MSLYVRIGNEMTRRELRTPFSKVDNNQAARPSATRLFRELDAYSNKAGDRQHANDQIEVYLKCAIHAYAAQWLPLILEMYNLPASHVQEIIRDCWRAARKDMLKVINRVSYRSILALYLFVQTPVPVGISEDEELDGISGAVCMQTALSHLQQLRARRSPEADNTTPQFIDYENRAYWAALTWETSIALTSDSRTFLTSGLRGACSEPTWRLVKAFLVGSFVPRADRWLRDGCEMTAEIAHEVMSVASISKTYIWKNISSVKEALREGVDEDGVLFAWKALLDAIQLFRTSIQPLLTRCHQQLHSFEQCARINWYRVSLQYYLGILLLVDALETAGRSDLLEEIKEVRQDAETECCTVLRVGLESEYTFDVSSDADQTNDVPRQSVTTTLVAMDPCPRHVVDYVNLLYKSICRQSNQKLNLYESFRSVLSDLLKTLRQLSQSSKSVQLVMKKLRDLVEQ
jgi:hypothetical protein